MSKQTNDELLIEIEKHVNKKTEIKKREYVKPQRDTKDKYSDKDRHRDKKARLIWTIIKVYVCVFVCVYGYR